MPQSIYRNFKLKRIAISALKFIARSVEENEVISVVANQEMTANAKFNSLMKKALLPGASISSKYSNKSVSNNWVCHPVYQLCCTNAFVHSSSGLLFLDEVKKYVVETSWGWGKFSTLRLNVFNRKKSYTIETESLPLYVCGSSGYHGVVDDLSFIIHLFKKGEKFEIAIGQNNKWLRNLLNTFVSSDVRIWVVPENVWVTSNKLILGTKSSFGEFIHPDLIRELNFAAKRLALPDCHRGKKIFISRGDSENRVFQEEKLIEQAFKERGFESVCLGDISVLEQVSLFHHADEVVGMHGAGFVNIAWAANKLRVHEFFHRNHFNGCYSSMAHVLGHEYSCTSLGWSPSSEYDTDFLIRKIEEYFS